MMLGTLRATFNTASSFSFAAMFFLGADLNSGDIIYKNKSLQIAFRYPLTNLMDCHILYSV